MIAASDPQEFIPRGRHQILLHPDPPANTILKECYYDELIENSLEKVSLTSDKDNEFWLLRQAPRDNLCDENCNINISDPIDQSQLIKGRSHGKSFNVSMGNDSKISATPNISKRCSTYSIKQEEDGELDRDNKLLDMIPNSKITAGYMEDELYVKGKTAIWSRGLFNNIDENDNGRKIICCYTIPFPIIQVLWSTFHRERPILDTTTMNSNDKGNDETMGEPFPAICVIDRTNIRIYLIKGENFVIPLPFQIEKVWNTKYGILIEKNIEGPVDDKSNLDFHGPIYSLAYPLDEVSPIAIKQNASITRLTQTNYKIVYTNDNPSICVIFDAYTKEHSICKIRKVRANEKDYGDTHSGYPSMSSFSSHRLKSKLSIWDKFQTSRQKSYGTPVEHKLSFIDKQLSNHQKSKSFNSLATISRCHTPLKSESKWKGSALRKDSFLNSRDSTHIKSFFNYSKSMSYVNSTPNICLEFLWTDKYSHQDAIKGGCASTVFLTQNLIGQWYLCYLLPLTSKLYLVEMNYHGSAINFGKIECLNAKDAINISHINMLAVLEHTGNVMLYSGLNVIGKLHISGISLQHTPSPSIRRLIHSPFPRRSSLLPLSKQSEPNFDEQLLSPVLPPSSRYSSAKFYPVTGAPTPVRQHSLAENTRNRVVLTGFSDSIANRISLKYFDDSVYRITLPLLSYSASVERCLTAVKNSLPPDTAFYFMCKWYATRNAIGNDDIDANAEWKLFAGLLVELLGFKNNTQEKFDSNAAANKRQKTTASPTGDEHWTDMLNSGHSTIDPHLTELLGLIFIQSESRYLPTTDLVNDTSIEVNTTLLPYLRSIHRSLHLLYEDFKLNTLYTESLLNLATLLVLLSNQLGLHDFIVFYWKDFPKNIGIVEEDCEKSFGKILNKTKDEWIEVPISVMNYIYKSLNGEKQPPYPYINNVNERSKNITELFNMLAEANSIYHMKTPAEAFAERIGQSVTGKNNRDTRYQEMIENIVLRMVNTKIDVRYLDTLPTGIYYIFYTALWKCRENPPLNWPSEAYDLILRADLVTQSKKNQMEENEILQLREEVPITESANPLVKKDTTDPAIIDDGMEDVDNISTHMCFNEDMRVMEAKRMLDSSKPVSVRVVQRPDITDHDFIEEQEKHLYAICLRTMALPVGRGMFTLRTRRIVMTESLPIPPLCLTGIEPPRGNKIELTHIDTPANMAFWPSFHNGVANGLRITPDAQNIDNSWIIFNKPKNANDTYEEHAGFLLALGLSGHLKKLDILSKFDYFNQTKPCEVLSIGILLGLAAAYRGTSNQKMTKLLAIHMEAMLPPTLMELDVPQYLQVTALLGIGLVYQGTAHRHVTEALLSDIGRPPGPEMDNSIDRESYALAAGLALGLVMLRHGGERTGMSDLNIPDVLHYYMVGGNKRPFNSAQKDKYKTPSFQIREGSAVNLDITAPGATLALGMMYMGTGNKAISDWMSPPATQYLLDFVRPDFLMLRVLSKSLILWKDIDPSKEWIESQVPSSIRPNCLITPTNYSEIDYEAMNQAYCNIIAGACFAIGLRFAGSADQDAFETLLHYCHKFTSLSGKSIADLAGKATVETCLNVLLLSASMVMAGTGNLEIMRLIRHLRKRVGTGRSTVVTYGSHLVVHMALGLLFLSGGRFSLSNTPENVAAMICAFYPKFPTYSNDNRYHLQAFRHLYVLAAEPRLVMPLEIHSNSLCYAKLRIVKLDGCEKVVRAPTLIPDLNTLKKISVDDERFYPVVFERGRNWDLLLKILATNFHIDVKQRTGYLSYMIDKYGYQSELTRPLTQNLVYPWNPPLSSIKIISDKSIKKFCETILHVNGNASELEQKYIKILIKATYDAVTQDKIITIVVMAMLFRLIIKFEYDPKIADLWQFKLISRQVLSKNPLPSLISKETIVSIHQEMKAILKHHEIPLKRDFKAYVDGKEFTQGSKLFSAYLIYNDVPNSNLPNLNNSNELFENIHKLKRENLDGNIFINIFNL